MSTILAVGHFFIPFLFVIRLTLSLKALNVTVKMEPNQIYPFNKRSFYIPDGKMDIGGGIELWRGIFQSVRPTVDRLFVNIDLSTGMMYKEGPLMNLCIDFFGRESNTSPNSILVPGVNLGNMERIKLQKFLSGVRVQVPTTGDKERVVRGLSTVGAHQLTFESQPGVKTTVANYFQSLGINLQYPTVICALVCLLLYAQIYSSSDNQSHHRSGGWLWYPWSSVQFRGANLCANKFPKTKSRTS